MFNRVKETAPKADALFDNFFSGNSRPATHNKNVASLATQAVTSNNDHGRNNSLVGGPVKDSVLSFDSINVRKTTQLGVRSSGFFLKDEVQSTKATSQAMGYKRVSDAFNK